MAAGNVGRIPDGIYCYDEHGVCPYWSKDASQREQENGYCGFLQRGDWEDPGISMLWDQVKECGLNMDLDEEDLT